VEIHPIQTTALELKVWADPVGQVVNQDRVAAAAELMVVMEQMAQVDEQLSTGHQCKSKISKNKNSERSFYFYPHNLRHIVCYT
jgi:hypothetical protein